MARIRTIKPEFPQSQSMGSVSRDARLTFILLWTLADDAGRTRGDSRMLASLLFPYDRDAPDLIGGWLAELEREGCVMRYRVDGRDFLQVVNWSTHQKVDRPSGPKMPGPEEGSRVVASPREDSRTLVVGSGSGPGPVSGPGPRPGEGSQGGGTSRSPSLATVLPSKGKDDEVETRLQSGVTGQDGPSLPVEVLADRIRPLIVGGVIAADDVDGLAKVMRQPHEVIRAALRKLNVGGQP